MLEHHAHFASEIVDVLFPLPVGHCIVGDCLSVEFDNAGVGDFEQVQAAQKRAFARTGRADDDEHFSCVYFVVDAFEHVQRAETFVQRAYAQHRL